MKLGGGGGLARQMSKGREVGRWEGEGEGGGEERGYATQVNEVVGENGGKVWGPGNVLKSLK